MCQQQRSSSPKSSRAPGAQPRQRLKLWELDPHLHCSVIGTCASLDDLRRICARVGLRFEAPLSDYELHHSFVAMADRPLPAIRQLHKTLERKYRDLVARFSQCADEGPLERAWRDAVAAGEVAGAYWAVLTHPALSVALRDRVTGEVHMLSHLSGATQRKELKRVHWLERRVASLESRLEQRQQDIQRRQNRHREKVQRLQLRLREAMRGERQLAGARARLEALENNDLVRRLRDQVESYAAQLSQSRLAQERAEAARDEARRRAEFEHRAHCRTRDWLGRASRERDALEAYVQADLDGRCSGVQPESEPGREVDLCGRCLLYVGGRQNVTAHLSQLVQRCNGRLICHDGGREDSRAHLANLLPQADAVLCPLDCVSHDAYQRLKRFCRQYAKRLVLLPSASVSAFMQSLRELQPV